MQVNKYFLSCCGLLLYVNIYFSFHGDYKDIVHALVMFLLASVPLQVVHHGSSSRDVYHAHRIYFKPATFIIRAPEFVKCLSNKLSIHFH